MLKLAIQKVLVVAVRDASFEDIKKKGLYANPMTHGTKPVDYIAFYRVKPISAITHYGKVSKIEHNVKYGKYFKKKPSWFKNGVLMKCYHLEWIKQLETPIGASRKHKSVFGPKYSTLDKLLSARTLSGIR